jgi:hypothetical protein
MIQAIAYALALMTSQPVFCTETLDWDGSPFALGYIVTVSFEGPDKKLYSYSQTEKESRAQILTPYGRKVYIMVGAVYEEDNGDVYTLTSEPFQFEGCASKKRK